MACIVQKVPLSLVVGDHPFGILLKVGFALRIFPDLTLPV